MQVLIWLGTGMAVGWVIRTSTRSRRDFGFLGDLVTGALGGVGGGWFFRRLGVTGMEGPTAHVLVALGGAIGRGGRGGSRKPDSAPWRCGWPSTKR